MIYLFQLFSRRRPMRLIYCDVCRNQITEEIIDRTVFMIGHYEICENCKNLLEEKIKTAVKEKKPFGYGWFDNLILDTLDKAAHKGEAVVSSAIKSRKKK